MNGSAAKSEPPVALVVGASGGLGALALENALGRFSPPGEVARFIVFLAATRNISGQMFQLDSRAARWC